MSRTTLLLADDHVILMDSLVHLLRPDFQIVGVVHDGRAMVESGRYGIYEVGPGAPLPGVGKVEAVRRQDGRWVVVTPKGLIVSSR